MFAILKRVCFCSIFTGFENIVRFLIERGSNVNATDENGDPNLIIVFLNSKLIDIFSFLFFSSPCALRQFTITFSYSFKKSTKYRKITD